jgi:hypothetical protein
MSPRLLFLLSSHHPLTRERDRIDAELAAARLRPRAWDRGILISAAEAVNREHR